MAERKIGEIFEYNGEWYQCVESDSCGECSLFTTECGSGTKSDLADKVFGQCSRVRRSDNKHAIFKKLEKVGEPYYNSDKKLCQQYKCYTEPLIADEIVYVFADNRAVIEIKQNKEDMEEKKIQLKQEDIDYLTRKIRYLVYKTNDYDRATEEIMNLFIPSDTVHSSSEKIGKNLKPFDLEEAKAGKPVCTRDGRKARIICFDMNSFNNHIIVALITEENGTESIYSYTSEGKWKETKTENDLMMLSEKKEGWINIYNADTTFYYVDGRVFDTKDEAVKEAKEEVEKEQREKNEYIDTIRVEWEE